ncbi:MAG TPA: hypothetical protein DCE42_27195 [Myxococcales bacterium]|nr:hypothetical protein [Deltaproteobacteria bacterium]MBU49642.1 hypothetical protein [Deltaproteobacteria bacterium]HAA58479.1 hypothetical protein [Myxococcales bacterium]
MLSHNQPLSMEWYAGRITSKQNASGDSATPCERTAQTVKREEERTRDKEWIRKIKAGEREAFQQLYQTYSPQLYQRILRLTGHTQQAEDCLQQVFLRVIEHIHHYRGEGHLYGWLLKIATNEVLQLFRKQGRYRTFQAAFFVFMQPEGETTPLPEQIFLEEERRVIVHKALQRLDHRKRIVVLLCDLEGEKLEDVAVQLSIPKGTVASRLHHARRDLRKYIAFECKQSGFSVEDWYHA